MLGCLLDPFVRISGAPPPETSLYLQGLACLASLVLSLLLLPAQLIPDELRFQLLNPVPCCLFLASCVLHLQLHLFSLLLLSLAQDLQPKSVGEGVSPPFLFIPAIDKDSLSRSQSAE